MASTTEKAISIKCGGEQFVDFEELNWFQGKLKSITEDNFKALKQSIIEDGIVIGFHAWRDENGKVWTIDGHHRHLALNALKSEGWFVPPIPVSFVQSATKKEAAKAVLISNARFAKLSDESFSDFMIDFDLKLDDIKLLDLPDVDLSYLNGSQKELSNTSEELALDDFSEFEHKCPKCGFEWDGETNEPT